MNTTTPFPILSHALSYQLIEPARLNKFFAPFSEELAAAGISFPDHESANGSYYDLISAALASPDQLPSPLRIALLTLEKAAAPDNANRLDDAIQRRIRCVNLHNRCPVDCALELWFRAPDELIQFQPLAAAGSIQCSVFGIQSTHAAPLSPASPSSINSRPLNSEVLPLTGSLTDPLAIPAAGVRGNGFEVGSSTFDVQSSSSPSDAESFTTLARLSPAEYDRARRAEAKRLDLRIETLDTEVAKCRTELNLESQANAVQLPAIEPWPEPVDGAEALDQVASRYSLYLVLPPGAADAMSLWTTHTHALDAFHLSPRLSLYSPKPGCGKTTAFDVLTTMLPRPLRTENISPAVLFRLVDQHQPALLLDEVDAYLPQSEELRGLLNAGHKRGACAYRCEGEGKAVRAFRAFAPAALAGIGSLPATLRDRSVLIPLVPAEEGQITIAERKRILLDNIYGVDIDAQAVETTKLSLLLKVLEGETQQTLQPVLRMFQERALPDLGDNIKCGNSLIGPDFYQQQQMTLLDDEERYRINVFDWQKEFPQVFGEKRSADELRETAAPLDYTMPGVPLHGSYSYKKRKAPKAVPAATQPEPKWEGGFDAVTGNPPYGFHQIHSERVKHYFKSHYASSSGSFEHYFLFYEASLKKLRQDGYHGFIVPVTWLTIPSAGGLRRFVLTSFSIRSIAWLPELVFKNAQVNTLVSIIRRSKSDVTRVLISHANNPALAQGITSEVEQAKFVAAGNIIHIFESTPETVLLEKVESHSVPLKSLARPCSGYNPYEIGTGVAPNGKPHTKETVESRPYHSETKQGKDWKPETVGRDLRRFSLQWPKDRFIKYGPWLAAARDPENFAGPRLLVQEITGGSQKRIIATFCNEELYHSRDVIPIKCDLPWPSPLFFLGILNSWLITWRHHRRSPKAKKALFPKVLVGDLKDIPIPKLSPTNATDKSRHDQMIKLVEQMLDLHQRLSAAKTPQEKTAIERQISATDTQIDRLVYELYDLTDDEIKIVEGACK